MTWLERHGMSDATYQCEFDTWTAPSCGCRLIRVSGSGSSGQARFAADFEKSSKTGGWFTRHGMTAARFTTADNDLHARGFRIVSLDGFCVGATAYHNGVVVGDAGQVVEGNGSADAGSESEI